jgi:lipopolysaccharide cholinephosphotransferase
MKEMTLEEIKECSVGILDFIDKVCHENNLIYYLCGGTLLGAIRHKGFIPWDDDIDIMMPRSDYEKLFEVWPKNDRYAVLNYKNTENFPFAYGKSIDMMTVKIESIIFKGIQMGVDVDIFPIDGLPSDDEEARMYYKRIEKMQNRLSLQLSSFGKGRNLSRTIARNIRLFFLRICDTMGITSWYKVIKKFDDLAQLYTGKNTGFCGITAISHYGIKEKNKIDNYKEGVLVIFEGKEYPVPNGYSDYLSRLYGRDYMQLPPEEQRETHHSYKAYWK